MFRLFDKSVGEMTYNSCINLLGEDMVIQSQLCGGVQTFTGGKLNDLIVMCMLPIQDKNGINIFPYDIVRTPIGNFYIKWCEECKSFQCFYSSEEFGEECYSCLGDFLWCEFVEMLERNEVEVIGNMLEHPERLESE